LNTERARATKIALPPLEVQRRIVDECERLEQTKNKFFASNMNAKDFEKLIKEKKNEIIKKYL